MKKRSVESDGLVSVIIPVFNVAEFVSETLDSVTNQTYNNLEIIIIDDGSTDGSGEICEEYKRKDDRIIVVHQKNKGLSAARNTGLNMISGNAVAFLDSDDVYRPEFIEKTVEALIREKSDLIVCRYTIPFTNGRMKQDVKDKRYPSIDKGSYDRVGALQSLVEKKINNHVWNKLYRRSLWENIRFPVGHVFEDIDTTYRIIDQCERIYVIDEPLYLKRKHSGTITNTLTKKNIEEWLLARTHFESFVRKNTPGLFTEEQLDRFMQRKIYRLFDSYALCLGRNIDNELVLREYLRQELMNTRDEMKGCVSIHGKVIFQIISICPWLLRTVCQVYYATVRRLHTHRKHSGNILPHCFPPFSMTPEDDQF